MSTWERQKSHTGPVLFTAPKITGALIHLSIPFAVNYLLKIDAGCRFARAVGDMLGRKEFDVKPVGGDRIPFYTLLSAIYAGRWMLGMFTANGGGPVTRGGLPDELNQWDYVAAILSVLAGILQHGSELQRLLFKLDPSNKGQVHMSGLFYYARFINITGHFLQEVSMALATRSVVLALFCGMIANYLFFQLAVETDQHMREKYREKYERYCQQTPYKFIPFVW
eukprot:CAMPEP_0178542970 /NCGR_PEP_ID=MMETSP0697-20121206/2333_1 /TAXON_ID=265572 /ORGANISM="Extubocellulus spinifer, Strain CCMP396" /LENGTH=223 /DNA_ID=CAMNT_0020175387 /DNA_START=140 /DNA_END=811 /DNA_ORIENTATION=+